MIMIVRGNVVAVEAERKVAAGRSRASGATVAGVAADLRIPQCKSAPRHFECVLRPEVIKKCLQPQEFSMSVHVERYSGQ